MMERRIGEWSEGAKGDTWLANVLTQSEIDALLNSLTSGEDVQPEKEEQPSDQAVRLYDFRTANKFSKEQMRTLHTISDNFATVLSTRMTGMLRTLSEVTVISVEETEEIIMK